MDEFIRSYGCSLTFTSNGPNDPENDTWVCYNNDKISSSHFSFNGNSPLDNSGKIDNTIMTISQDKCHLRCKRNIDFTQYEQYTLSLRFKIDPDYLMEILTKNKIVPGVWWYGGEIILLDKSRHVDDGLCIVIWMRNERFEIPVFYSADSGYVHLLLTLDHGMFTVYFDGAMYVNKAIRDPIYRFDDLKLGNYVRNLMPGEIEQDEDIKIEDGPVVNYDELVIVNDILYKDQFTVPTHYIHDLFPEYIERVDNSITKSGYRDSVRDTLHSFEITRHRDYQPPRTYLTDSIEKYDFDNDSKDARSAYFKKY